MYRLFISLIYKSNHSVCSSHEKSTSQTTHVSRCFQQVTLPRQTDIHLPLWRFFPKVKFTITANIIVNICTYCILTIANTGAVANVTNTIANCSASPSITTFWTFATTTIDICFILIFHLIITCFSGLNERSCNDWSSWMLDTYEYIYCFCKCYLYSRKHLCTPWCCYTLDIWHHHSQYLFHKYLCSHPHIDQLVKHKKVYQICFDSMRLPAQVLLIEQAPVIQSPSLTHPLFTAHFFEGTHTPPQSTSVSLVSLNSSEHWSAS